MYAYYEHPVDECVAAAPAQRAVAPEIAVPAPTEAVAPAPAIPAAPQAAVRTVNASTASHRTAARGELVVVHHPRFRTRNHSRHLGHRYYSRHHHRHLSAKQRRHAHWLALIARYHRLHHG